MAKNPKMISRIDNRIDHVEARLGNASVVVVIFASLLKRAHHYCGGVLPLLRRV
jgi:hypothetical protein